MSEFDAHDNETAEADPRPATGAFISTSSLRDGGATYTESLLSPANENITALNMQLTAQLPHEIQAAIGEWADYLKQMPWNLRRRAIKRFAGASADNFLANTPLLSDEKYESLADIGTTCILEQLDDGGPMQDTHQAHCYLDSVHGHHQAMARAYLATNRPKAVTVH
jgi:hypothetical protein